MCVALIGLPSVTKPTSTARQELQRLKNERENEPVSDLDLLVHYKRLRAVFESLQATLCVAAFPKWVVARRH